MSKRRIHDGIVGALVKQLNDKWNAAFNRGDAAGVADLYADDAVAGSAPSLFSFGAAISIG